MTLVRKTIGDGDPATGSDGISVGFGGIVRWVALPGIGLVFAAWLVAIVAGLHSAASLASADSFVPHLPPLHAKIASGDIARSARQAPPVVRARKSDRLAFAAAASPKSVPQSANPSPRDPFAEIVAQAGLSPDKVLAALARAGMKTSEPRAETPKPTVASLAMPLEERFFQMAAATGPLPARFGAASAAGSSLLAPGLTGKSGFEIAYAMPEPLPDEAAWGSLARLTQDPIGESPETTDAAGLPDSVVLPPSRPKRVAAAPSPGKVEPPAKPDAEALAFARPDKPAGGIAGAFKNLFNGPAQKGVAIYDISAGMVYMPDGQKLEAHSGIGKMADNPRYAHVRMNGPTPPNTYKLSLRESLFHGVEAIRMTPMDEEKMHGRDGILAHSYLLRGGREESHGCVAFEDYPRFLKAFKKGKVKQLIVVPSLSRRPAAPKSGEA